MNKNEKHNLKKLQTLSVLEVVKEDGSIEQALCFMDNVGLLQTRKKLWLTLKNY